MNKTRSQTHLRKHLVLEVLQRLRQRLVRARGLCGIKVLLQPLLEHPHAVEVVRALFEPLERELGDFLVLLDFLIRRLRLLQLLRQILHLLHPLLVLLLQLLVLLRKLSILMHNGVVHRLQVLRVRAAPAAGDGGLQTGVLFLQCSDFSATPRKLILMHSACLQINLVEILQFVLLFLQHGNLPLILRKGNTLFFRSFKKHLLQRFQLLVATDEVIVLVDQVADLRRSVLSLH